MLNTQRDKVYLDRRKALVSQDLSPLMIEYAERTVDDILEVPPLLTSIHSSNLPPAAHTAPKIPLS